MKKIKLKKGYTIKCQVDGCEREGPLVTTVNNSKINICSNHFLELEQGVKFNYEVKI